MIIPVIRSLIILLVISGAVGYTTYELNFGFSVGFVGALLTQIAAYNITRYVRDSIMTVKLKAMQVEEIKSFEQQGIELNCAHCKEPVFAPIRLDQQNSFDCPACGKSNAVYVNMTVARETDSINMDAITTRLLIDEEERAKDEIRISGSKEG